MKERAKRCRARANTKMVIRRRDIEILLSIAKAKFLTTKQISKLHCGGSVRVAQRRLRALLDHGLLVGALQAELLHRPSIFRPTPRGIDLLADHGHPGLPKASRIPKPVKLRHAVATRDVFVVAYALERASTWKLDVVLFDTELSADPVLRAAELVPDVLIHTRPKLGSEPVLVFVEVDLGSEPVATLMAKIERYALLRAGSNEYGEAEVVFVVEGERRRERVVALVGGRRVHVAGPEEVSSTLRECSGEVFAPPRRALRTGCDHQVRAITTGSGLRKRGVCSARVLVSPALLTPIRNYDELPVCAVSYATLAASRCRSRSARSLC